MSKAAIEIMCETSDELADKDATELFFNGDTFRMPNGWMERRDDWDRVVSEFFPEFKEK